MVSNLEPLCEVMAARAACHVRALDLSLNKIEAESAIELVRALHCEEACPSLMMLAVG